MSDRNFRARWMPWSRVGTFFGDLNVRPKMMVLHNLFFLVLAASVYLSLIPPFERAVMSAKARENSLLTKLFLDDQSLQSVPGIAAYDYREGAAPALGISPEISTWLELHPGQIYRDPGGDRIYRLVPTTGQFRRLDAPNRSYNSLIERAKRTIFVVLGALYCLAVLLLELAIMPRYVHRPIQRFLDADRASQSGDVARELIPENEIMGDEIGRIMRSRNQTIAKLREKEAELEAAKRSLEEQDRLASLGLLSASVAHELNTPLAVLLGSIEKLAENGSQPIARDRLDRMRRVAQRLKKISESLVDFARARRDRMEPVDLRPVVDEAWSLVAIDEKSNEVRFRNEVEPAARAIGNHDRLIQVFVNLLRNALNAVESGGNVCATSREAREGGRTLVSIRVEDDGPGIPPDVLPDIFEAFVTTRLDARGTGLGLTVAEGIVSQHGGTISASNRPGGGALLEVRLPAA